MKRSYLIAVLVFSLKLSVAQELKDSIKNKENLNNTEVENFEEMPTFVGGESERIKYLQRNINYPQIEKEAGISGTVYLQFTIMKDGSVDSVKILKGVTNGKGLDKEALKLVKNMPKWNPGRKNYQPVNVVMNMPIKFVLKDGSNYTEEQKRKNAANGYYNKGVEYADKGDLTKALEQFEEAIKINALDEDALFNKGIMLYKLDRKSEACETWNALKNSGSKLANEVLQKYCN